MMPWPSESHSEWEPRLSCSVGPMAKAPWPSGLLSVYHATAYEPRCDRMDTTHTPTMPNTLSNDGWKKHTLLR